MYASNQSWKLTLIFLALFTGFTLLAQSEREIVFSEDFESGWGSWWADNGSWDVGIPTVGPDAAHSGINCAGTILDGNYSNYANTTLISPSVSLPGISEGESIQMKFWQWFTIENGDDQGYIQISVDGGDWETISDVEIDGSNPCWSQYVADLTVYAGSTIRIGFYFTSDFYETHSGWYIDDVSIETGVVNFLNPEDFESGVGNWSADNGLWEVGIPTVGPSGTHLGVNCVGTVLNGVYSNYANTRLISPSVSLPGISEGESIQMKFWQWFTIENGDDQGYVQISVDGGDWETISDVEIDGSNPCWSQYVADLTAYAGSTIRIGFYFTSDFYETHSGWYIDDVSIETGVVNFLNPEDFESGVGNWSADNGLWEVGIPTVGPSGTHSGVNCAGTVLNGVYSNYANTRFISPEVKITPMPNQMPMFFFYQWFSIESNDDKGYIQVSVNNGDWQTVGGPITGGNDAWPQYGLDLSDYIDSTLRFAFYFTSDFYETHSGWYIDDIRIEGIVTDVDDTENELTGGYVLKQNFPNPFTNQTQIKYEITSSENIHLEIYNLNGKLVKTLVDERQNQGEYSITWNGKNNFNQKVSPGIYYYSLKTNAKALTKKMLILK